MPLRSSLTEEVLRMPATTDNKANSTFVAFMPRQVLLGMKHSNDNNASFNGNVRLKPEEKVLLHNSIGHYLHRCGFSKTLKKLRSEAQIEVGLSWLPFLAMEWGRYTFPSNTCRNSWAEDVGSYTLFGYS